MMATLIVMAFILYSIIGGFIGIYVYSVVSESAIERTVVSRIKAATFYMLTGPITVTGVILLSSVEFLMDNASGFCNRIINWILVGKLKRV